jgi:hypothetical protein
MSFWFFALSLSSTVLTKVTALGNTQHAPGSLRRVFKRKKNAYERIEKIEWHPGNNLGLKKRKRKTPV